jgi:hypothetical protein
VSSLFHEPIKDGENHAVKPDDHCFFANWFHGVGLLSKNIGNSGGLVPTAEEQDLQFTAALFHERIS